MRKSKNEILETVKAIIGEDNNTDEVIALYEDINDSVIDDETQNRINELETEVESWKEKFSTNDSEWRAKYKERFFEGGEPTSEPEPEPVAETFDDLFTDN